eukprot:m.161296 g.161296  ORF g.161296 m.161296 type:complete len:381 (-) comp31224_c0_seq3:118-1260(-)
MDRLRVIPMLVLLTALTSPLTRGNPTPSAMRLSKSRCDRFNTPLNTTGLTIEPPPLAKHLTHIFWIHVPKCATSFGYVIASYSCAALPAHATMAIPHQGQQGLGVLSIMANFANKYHLKQICPPTAWEPSMPLAYHYPVPSHLAGSGHGVTMLRDPRTRLYSAFKSLHAQGMDPSLRKRLKETVTTFKEYVRFPGIQSCQVKMMIGHQCASAYNPTAEDLVEAKRRLRTTFAFIGLTDHYDLSVCLFHAMLGGKPRAQAFENSRPTAFFSQTYDSKHAANVVTFDDDPLDAALYHEARVIFTARLREHHLEVPVDLADDVGVEPEVSKLEPQVKTIAEDTVLIQRISVAILFAPLALILAWKVIPRVCALLRSSLCKRLM